MKTIPIILITALTFVTSAYADIRVNILGAVNRQGHFVIKEPKDQSKPLKNRPATLLDLIGLAEGISKQGDSKKILIRKVDEKVILVEVNLMDVIRGKAENPILSDGDLVYVSDKLL